MRLRNRKPRGANTTNDSTGYARGCQRFREFIARIRFLNEPPWGDHKVKARHYRILFAWLGISLLHNSANAAAIRVEAPACKDEETLKKGFESPAAKAGKAAGDNVSKTPEAFFNSMFASGECIKLEVGQIVVIDVRHGGLWCVRQAGGLDCLWTLARAINLNPPKPGALVEGPQHPKKPY